MRKTIKRILAFFLSAVCILSCTLVCMLICNHPSEEVENTVSSFYREPVGSIDVVMIGSSASGKDFFPSVLWKENGITSYCMCIAACSGNIYASVLKEVLSRQPQALILVDIDGFLVEDHFQQEADPIRLWVDSMPYNRNRWETVKELCSDNILERIFPFSRYHRNLTSLFAYIPITARLVKKQLLNVRDPMKGAVILSDTPAQNLQILDISTLPPQDLTPLSGKYFDLFLQTCTEFNVENVLFVDFPKAYDSAEKLVRNQAYGARALTIQRTAQQHGFELYTFNTQTNAAILDLTEDFRDTLHCTATGGVKCTKALGDFLKNHYSFPEKSDDLTAQWNADTADAL